MPPKHSRKPAAPAIGQNWADDDDASSVATGPIIDDASSIVSAPSRNTKSNKKTQLQQIDNTTEASSVIKDDHDDDDEDDDDSSYDYSDTSSDYDDEEEEGCCEDSDQDDFTAPLPEHACRYCRRSNPMSAVRCHVCKRWFCNTGGGSRGSHIVLHLATCRHKEVSLHPEGPLGDGSVLECFVCGSKNVFLLGFVPSKEEQQMIILCREPCLNSSALEDMDWDPEAWSALIEERELLPWIASNSDRNDLEEEDENNNGNKKNRNKKRLDPRIRHITMKQILSLEDKWKIDPDADLDTVLPGRAAESLPEIPADFVRGEDYAAVFSAHVEAEALTDKESKEKQSWDSLHVKWSGGGGNGRRVATFEIPTSDNILKQGDECVLVYPDTQQTEATGVVLSITAAASMADELQMELRPGAPEPPVTIDVGYRLRATWNKTTYERMHRALRTFANEETSISAYLFARILGQPVRDTARMVKPQDLPRELNVPGLPALNPSQHDALTKALMEPLSLIQGPPGTGKSTLTSALVYHLAKVHQQQILVCAPSNVAVDHICERIAKTGLNVVRVCAKSRELVSTAADRFTLHQLVRDFVNEAARFSDLAKLFKLRDTVGNLNDSDKRRFAKMCGEVERLILEEADVICATTVSCGDPRLQQYRFKYVVIDECTHATEPESLIPLVSGAKQAILVGDHCQMRPVVLSRAAENAGLARSLFERLVVLGERPHRLEIQYRMAPCLSEFSSNFFYEGALANGVTAEERDASRVFPWPDPKQCMFLYNSIAPEELGPSGVSYLNRAEAALAERIVTRLLKSGQVTPDQIGIITPYEAQRCYLVNYLVRNGTMPQEAYRKIEVQSVDAFQGREKEFIVFTCVRSNDQQGIGFVQDWRRLNVALTRAKRGLAVIGNARVLARNPLWHALVSHFKERGLLVQGSVDQGLTPVTVALPKPRVNPHLMAEMAQNKNCPQHYMPAFMSDASSSVQLPMLVNPGGGGAAAAAALGTIGDQMQQQYVPGNAYQALMQFQRARADSSSCATSSVGGDSYY